MSTLKDQIVEIATRWFYPEFAKMPVPRIVYALAIEAFRRDSDAGACDKDAIHAALTLVDSNTWNDDEPDVPCFDEPGVPCFHTDANKPQCECH